MFCILIAIQCDRDFNLQNQMDGSILPITCCSFINTFIISGDTPYQGNIMGDQKTFQAKKQAKP
jgi:hypothetical protein